MNIDEITKENLKPGNWAKQSLLGQQKSSRPITESEWRIRYSREEYAEYLQTDHWKALREATVTRDPICVICKSLKTAEVHHLRYRNIYDVTIEDLIGVCPDCHEKIHSNVSTGEDLTFGALKERLKRSRVTITEDLIAAIKQTPSENQRRIRGILKVVNLDSMIGTKIGKRNFDKILELMKIPFFRSKRAGGENSWKRSSAWMKRTKGNTTRRHGPHY